MGLDILLDLLLFSSGTKGQEKPRKRTGKKEEGEEERGEDGGFSRDPLIGGAPIPLVSPVSF